MANLVCEDCGSETFTQRRYAVIEYEVAFDAQHGEWDTGREECVDGGERDTPIVCDDCGAEVATVGHEGLIPYDDYMDECD